MKRLVISLSLILGLLAPSDIAFGESEIQLRTATEHVGGYDRTLFKHWIDADKNGCDTRKEVLIAEAVVKPKKGAKCILTGGKWISAYDGKSYTKDVSLDIDHVVPLAEAWRSGAWAWTAQQRQDFANDLTDSRVLIAVTASANRSKGDQDVKTWLPEKNRCGYIEAWVAVKVRYSLTFDTGELSVIQSYFTSCTITNVSVDVLPGYETIGNKIVPSPTPSPSQTTTVSPSPSATPTQASGSAATETQVSAIQKAAEYNACQSRNTIASASATIANPNPKLEDCGPNPANVIPSPAPTKSATPTVTPTAIVSASPTTTATQVATVSPGTFCSPAGATGKSAAGVTYTCKTSPTDARNRWRQ